MECAICGTKLLDGALFCTKCGARVGETVQQPAVNPVIQQPAPEETPDQTAQHTSGWQPTYAYQTDAQDASAGSAVQGMGAGTGSAAQQGSSAGSAAVSIAGGILGNLRLIGVIVAAIASIPVGMDMIEMTFGIKMPFHLPGSYETQLLIIGIIAIVCYLIVGIRECLSLIWRMVRIGFYFPLWPVNYITGFCTFALGGLVAWGLPVVVTAIVFFKDR